LRSKRASRAARIPVSSSAISIRFMAAHPP
jgi:hypothetical protein